MKNFKTEHPFVVTTKGGNIKGRFYSAGAAVTASKAVKQTRFVYAMHRGSWELRAAYTAGRAWSKQELHDHLHS